MPTAPTIKLNSGYEMPMVGLGTWNTFDGKPGQIKRGVECAIDCGYRHIDAAWLYRNENEVGEAIMQKVKEGKIKREDVFITSKLWNNFHNPKDIRPALKESLKSLQTDYLDLYLVHWPFAYANTGELFPKDENGELLCDNIDYIETWKVMEELLKEGSVRSIGVSNFNLFQLQRVLKEGCIKPAVNQVELHPYLPQPELVDFCQKQGIVLTAYCPLGSPGSIWKDTIYPTPIEEPKLKAIASRVKRTPAQVILKYFLQRNITVVPKSKTPSRIQSNIELFDFDLTEEDLAIFKSLGSRNHRINSLEMDMKHKYFPFKENYAE